jgi:hypothetical protein
MGGQRSRAPLSRRTTASFGWPAGSAVQARPERVRWDLSHEVHKRTGKRMEVLFPDLAHSWFGVCSFVRACFAHSPPSPQLTRFSTPERGASLYATPVVSPERPIMKEPAVPRAYHRRRPHARPSTSSLSHLMANAQGSLSLRSLSPMAPSLGPRSNYRWRWTPPSEWCYRIHSINTTKGVFQPATQSAHQHCCHRRTWPGQAILGMAHERRRTRDLRFTARQQQNDEQKWGRVTRYSANAEQVKDKRPAMTLQSVGATMLWEGIAHCSTPMSLFTKAWARKKGPLFRLS